MPGNAYESVTGIIQSANDKGILIEGQESYFNFSGFHRTVRKDGPPTPKGSDWCIQPDYDCAHLRGIPAKGTEVTVTVDAKRYIREMEIDGISGKSSATTYTPRPASSGSYMSAGDKMRITRLSCLESAIRYSVASGQRSTLDEVFSNAESMVSWALGSDGIEGYNPQSQDSSSVLPSAVETPVTSATNKASEGDIDFDELFGNEVQLPEEPDLTIAEFVGGYYGKGHSKSDLASLIGVTNEGLGQEAVESWKRSQGKTYRQILASV